MIITDLTYAQHWQNGFFDRTSLHSLGLMCNLGHNGDPCPGGSSPNNLTIIDINGCHKVQVVFCTCDPGIPWNERYRQLLQMCWYPASFTRPGTAFSFDLLEMFHKLTLQGKLNLYDFYLAVMQKSDNQGRSKPIVSNLSQIGLSVANFSPESISRNLSLRLSVETSQRCQTWGWRSSDMRPFCHVTRIIRYRVPRLSPPWTKPSRRLGCCQRRSQVSVSVPVPMNCNRVCSQLDICTVHRR